MMANNADRRRRVDRDARRWAGQVYLKREMEEEGAPSTTCCGQPNRHAFRALLT